MPTARGPALAGLTQALPTGPPLRRLLIGLSGIVVFAWLYQRWSLSSAANPALAWQNIHIPPDAHSMERLHLQAKRSHHERLSRQSSTWLEFKAEYIRRFGRDPPWAMSSWFQLAQTWKSNLLDDGFDDTVADAERYRAYYEHDCDDTQYSPVALDEWGLVQMCFGSGHVSVTGRLEKWYVEALRFMVADFKDWAPKICILLNLDTEPRVLLPHDVPATSPSRSTQYNCPRLDFIGKSRQSIWPDAEAACGPLVAETSADALAVSTNHTQMTDMCRLGRSFQHGGMLSPDHMSLATESARGLPVLSSAKLSPFQDILLPNPIRLTDRPRRLDFEDVAWRDKAASIYWRGSTQGGYARDSDWHFHRQNMVQHLHDFHRLAADVRFANATQCNERACNEQQEELPWGMAAAFKEAWKHTLVLDMDSNGPSDVLYDYLRSGSAVARHAFLREWHDDRLVPWLHYAPLSANLDQVDATLDYLLSPAGEAVAQGIAEEGALVANEALRFEDMKLYLIRLVLELGRYKRRSAA